MEEQKMQNQDSAEPSGAPALRKPPVIKSQSTKITETLERVRSQRAPFGDPTKPKPIVHRVRNEATEKDRSESPWCGGDYQHGELATILDCDVTCPACLEIIERRQADRAPVHFVTDQIKPLCGAIEDEAVGGLLMVSRLIETTCPACLDRAEELLVGLILDHGPKKDQKAGIPDVLEALHQADREHLDLQQAEVAALQDICQTLKEIRDCTAKGE